MALSGNQLNTFKQDVYRRIQIAAAVHLIKNTPKGKSAEAHAIDVQQKLKLGWLNSAELLGDHRSSIRIDEHILNQQQDALKLRLHSVVPQNNLELFEDAPVTPKETVSNEVYYENFNRDRCEVVANANFIQAIIHLKALAEAQSTIPIHHYIGSVSKMGNRNGIFPFESNKVATELASSNDSDFYNVEECQSSAVTPLESKSSSVASSMLLYILNSCNTDQLLEKSILAIINQLRKLSSGNEIAMAASKLPEVMDHWTGSVHQQAIKVLHAIIGEQTVLSNTIESSSNVLFTLASEITEIIIKKNAPNEISYLTKENQIMMVLELSKGTDIWFRTLELIFNALGDLTARIKREHDNSNETMMYCSQSTPSILDLHRNTQSMDQCFFLFRLLKTFLTSQHMNPKVHQGTAKELRPTSTQAAHKTVSGLWRKHYEIQNKRIMDNCSITRKLGPTKSDLRRWKNILDESFRQILEKHPVVSVLIYDSVQMLPSLH